MPLHDDEIRAALTDLPDWRAFANALHKDFRFRGFRAAIAFVDRVAAQSIAAAHHPRIEIASDRVMLTLTSSDEGGITERDVALAHAIERVREPSEERAASTG
ncbi:MAG TPA: 4a-hydroxytetrahydrobiopterin dehydratase [Actinomycetota bacterium]|nr:4a-hydroxytetrahydrobiopterin dehydratase [Actinomycetota bacterium]